MIAYTAWDSLQAIARQYDADPTLVPGERIAMAPRRERSRALATVRHFIKHLGARHTGAAAASGRRA